MKISRLAILATLPFLFSCSKIKELYKPFEDWWGEEIAEQIIEQKTTLDLDLSPDSKEGDK